MDRIVATLKPDEIGLQVANLQEALQLLLDRLVIRTFDPPNSPTGDELERRLNSVLPEIPLPDITSKSPSPDVGTPNQHAEPTEEEKRQLNEFYLMHNLRDR